MLRTVVVFALRRRTLVFALASVVVVFGIFSARQAQLDVFPDFVPPQVVVQTESPGFAADQVEALVTQPVEAAIAGLPGMALMRSESIAGLSVVTVVFGEQTDILIDRQLLSESLGDVGARLPQGAKAPRLSALTSATMDVLKIGLVSDRLSPLELRTLAEWTLRTRLLAIPGVARVNLFGGEVRQTQILLHPAALLAHQIGIADVLAAARDASVTRPAGFIDTINQRIPLATIGEPASLAALGDTVIAVRDGTPLHIADVADVLDAAAPRFGDALVQGRPGVLLTLSSQWGANTMDVTRNIEAALAELAPLFDREGVHVYPRLHRPASFIEASLANVGTALGIGSALVIAVLVLFLRDARTAFISLTAIPLSLLGAVIALRALGITLNTMTLGGLAIAIGEVVDDAIVDVENIVRRLRENEAAGRPRSAFVVVVNASLEVRAAVVYATASVALVFLPLLTMGGISGRFFGPLAQSYLLAIGMSLAVALTLTPALCLAMLGGELVHPHEPRIQTRIRARYAALLGRAVERPWRLYLGAVALLTLGLVTLPFLGGEFLPEFREGHLVLQLSGIPGTGLDESLRVGRQISEALLALPGIATVAQQVGRAEQGEDTWGTHRSEMHVELAKQSGDDEERSVEQVRTLLASFPGLQSAVLTFLGDRISETISGETADVVVNLFGDDLTLLDAKAAAVAEALGSVRGATDVLLQAAASAPRVTIRPRVDALARLGFRPAELLDQIETAYQGTLAAQRHVGAQTVDVVVVLDAESRRDPEAIGALLVRNAGGSFVPLREVAEIELSDARDSILHEAGRRRQTATCNVAGRDVSSFVAEARKVIAARVELPAGVYAVFAGTAEERAAAQREILLRGALGAVGIVLLLGTLSRSPRVLAFFLANVPLAMAGGVLAVLLSSWLGNSTRGLSLGSLVGFVTVFGITARNAILMISHFQHLVDEEGASWSYETAVRGATERVVPILMTALVAGLGLLPVALAANEAGGEIDGPMAIVILGGLATSTALNLFLLPVLCARYARFERAEDAAS
ncbi:MAG: acriflavin resistance protein [Deltaproteobacteria bacterium]|nr:acriflavin resistance protein [Deltaproteobacteria bacterium]